MVQTLAKETLEDVETTRLRLEHMNPSNTKTLESEMNASCTHGHL
jgi:hypothetical protein